MAKSRDHAWLPEEVILALEVYLDHEASAPIALRDALSNELREWPLEQHLAEVAKFRNRRSIESKLYNIQWHATDGQRGRPNGGTATRKVWEEYGLDDARVRAAAANVRASLPIVQPQAEPMDDVDEEYIAREGWLIRRVHVTRERDRRAVREKRAAARDRDGRLICEACTLDPATYYGDPAADSIIECHHKVPLSELEPGISTTRTGDLALVCPNCHRLAHARRPSLTWEQLIAAVRVDAQAPTRP